MSKNDGVKRWVFLLMGMCLMFMVAAVCNASEMAESEITWSITDDTLYIRGTGAMPDYIENLPEWHDKEFKKIVIEEGITSVSECAFGFCYDLRQVTLPSTLIKIEPYAFIGIDITMLDIPEGVEYIGYCAFRACEKLISVNIPASATDIERDVFDGCTSLTTITIAEGNPKYISEDGVWYEKREDKIYLIDYPAGKTNMEYTLPVSVCGINTQAFSECKKLASIHVDQDNSYFVSIDGVLFKRNGNHIELNRYPVGKTDSKYEIPSGVNGIHINAFEGCEGLSMVTIPESVEWISSWAFGNCKSLETVVILNPNMKFDEYEIFFNCSSNLTLYGYSGSSAQTYAEKNGHPFVVFEENAEITWSITDGILYIKGSGAMPDYETEKNGGKTAPWKNEEFTTVIIEKGITNIGDYAFWSSDITSVEIPEGVETIGCGAFGSCRKLTSVIIPLGVKEIETRAFWGSGITEIEIPEGVVIIGADAFSYCENLVSVKFPVSAIDVYTVGDIFEGCTSLVEINIADNHPRYVSENGIWCDKWEGQIVELIRYPAGKIAKEYTIPVSVESIRPYAFNDCNNLISLTISENVVYMADGMFNNCESLTSVTILNPDIDFVGSNVFAGCSYDLTIYGYADSTAQAYAEDYGYNFEVLSVVVPGDIDSDGVLDESDAELLAKYFAGYNVSINLEAADINGDGEVTRKDAMFLARYLAGWTGYEVAEK